MNGYGTILNVTNTTGAHADDWYQVRADTRTHIAMQASITSGTGTIIIEGRVGPNDQPVEITQFAATDGVMGAKFPQIRARIVNGAALTARVSIDAAIEQQA